MVLPRIIVHHARIYGDRDADARVAIRIEGDI
jgi:hypothetical protein